MHVSGHKNSIATELFAKIYSKNILTVLSSSVAVFSNDQSTLEIFSIPVEFLTTNNPGSVVRSKCERGFNARGGPFAYVVVLVPLKWTRITTTADLKLQSVCDENRARLSSMNWNNNNADHNYH